MFSSFCFQLPEKPTSLFTKKLVSFLFNFFFNGLHFLVSSLKHSLFLLRALFPQWKWNKSWGRRSFGYSRGFPMSPTQWISTFWDGSWWQWTLRHRNVLHSQEARGREALCRDRTLHQAGSQQLQDCCCCSGVLPGAKGRDTRLIQRMRHLYRPQRW